MHSLFRWKCLCLQHTQKGVERRGMAKYIFSLCVDSLIMDVWDWTDCSGFKSFSTRQHHTRSCTEPLEQCLVIDLISLLIHCSWYHAKIQFGPEEQADVSAQTAISQKKSDGNEKTINTRLLSLSRPAAMQHRMMKCVCVCVLGRIIKRRRHLGYKLSRLCHCLFGSFRHLLK